MIKCLVRFDDVCPTMDWNQFNRALKLVNSYDIKPLLGVVPDNHDSNLIKNMNREDFWLIVKTLQKEGFSIAMHGYHHVYDKKYPWTIGYGFKHSEFAGNSYKNQYEKIRKGKQILMEHGIYTDIFFAPAHTYDKNTLRALRDNGFKYISDGKAARPYKQYGITCIPCRSTSVPKVGKNGIFTAVCHPSEWSRPEKSSDYELIADFCKHNCRNIVSFEELKSENRSILPFAKINEAMYIFFSLIRKVFRKIMRFIRYE